MLMRASAAGVPMVVTFVPNRLQAAMLSAGEWPDGYAPKDIGDRVRQIVAANGGTFVDVLPHFTELAGAEHFYLAIDGHPTPAGYRFISEALALEMTAGTLPGLARTRQEVR